jgi:hypothetical protein
LKRIVKIQHFRSNKLKKKTVVQENSCEDKVLLVDKDFCFS